MRENKNNSVLKYMGLMLLRQKMALTGIQFGRVGHSHGSLGYLEFELVRVSNDGCLAFLELI